MPKKSERVWNWRVAGVVPVGESPFSGFLLVGNRPSYSPTERHYREFMKSGRKQGKRVRKCLEMGFFVVSVDETTYFLRSATPCFPGSIQLKIVSALTSLIGAVIVRSERP